MYVCLQDSPDTILLFSALYTPKPSQPGLPYFVCDARYSVDATDIVIPFLVSQLDSQCQVNRCTHDYARLVISRAGYLHDQETDAGDRCKAWMLTTELHAWCAIAEQPQVKVKRSMILFTDWHAVLLNITFKNVGPVPTYCAAVRLAIHCTTHL